MAHASHGAPRVACCGPRSSPSHSLLRRCCCFSNWLRDRLKSGGRACYLNLQPLASYDAFKIYNEEISILGTMAVLNSYGPAIDILNSGCIDTERMVSDTYTLEQFPALSLTCALARG